MSFAINAHLSLILPWCFIVVLLHAILLPLGLNKYTSWCQTNILRGGDTNFNSFTMSPVCIAYFENMFFLNRTRDTNKFLDVCK